jgi:hypothetical protein
MKFYPRDWRADEKLRICSLSARGLWIEMLAIMHGSERYGHLLINGNVPTDAQLAVLAGTSANQVTDLLGELETAGVFSRSATGAIYSRRMTADERKARTARNNGKRGGNPKLCKGEENPPSDKDKETGSDKDRDKLRSQKAEDSEANASGASADPAKQMFDLGVSLLTGSGQTEKQARSLIGKWRKATSAGEVLTALLDCRARAISNPIEWLEKRFVGSSGYVSKSGYRYRGDAEAVMREAERRGDNDTYWRVKGDVGRSQSGAAHAAST